MSARFEELAWAPTPMGAISLRRRLEPTLLVDVYEVKLGDEFLMSSLFTVAEVELAHRGLADTPGTALDVVVGGLGLGCTARAALLDPRVRSMTVVEARGGGAGWNLTLTSTQFQIGATGKTLPTTASTIGSVATACGASSNR